MYQHLGVPLLLCTCVLSDVAAMPNWKQSYSERIKSNSTFATLIENLSNENKYIPEECTDIRNGMDYSVYHTVKPVYNDHLMG